MSNWLTSSGFVHALNLHLNYKQHPDITGAQIPYHSRKHGAGTMSIEVLFGIACFAAESSKVYQEARL